MRSHPPLGRSAVACTRRRANASDVALAIVGIGLISVLLGLTHFDGGVFQS